jgi:cell division protein FtsZ
VHAQQPNAYSPGEPVRTAIGGVVIEEGYTPFSHQPARTLNSYAAVPPPVQSEHYPTPPPGFEPAPPAEIRRTGRRMPSVEDLPTVGQREWNARQGGMPQGQTHPGDEARKRGFFDRLTGLGRKPDNAPPPADQTTNEHQETPPLPVFFGRERR